MSSRLPIELLTPLENYANKLRDTYGSHLGGQPEDQLKAPVAELLESFASTMGFSGVLTESEARVSGCARVLASYIRKESEPRRAPPR
jgi:hypothetical protein